MDGLNIRQSAPEPGPEIWAVGGGKGGVGKSVFTTNLAIATAREGRRTVLLDADLGGANLHTLLGIPNPRRSLADFVGRDVPSLHETMAPTNIPNLWLISGAHALLDQANPRHAQKMKMLRHIRTLDVELVVMDLGAGSSYNILDFFLAADKGVLIIIPEPTSVENAYHFIKAAFYRRLKRATLEEGVAGAIDRVMQEKLERGVRSPRALIENVALLDPEAGEKLRREAESFHPRLVINQVSRWQDRELGGEIATACREYFGIQLGYLGYLEKDELVREAVQLKRPVLESFPASPFARGLQQVCRRLLHDREEEP